MVKGKSQEQDKRLEKTMEKAQEKRLILIQERRRILDLLLNLQKQEKYIAFKKEGLKEWENQLISDKITVEDRVGKVLSKEALSENIEAQKLQLREEEKQLNYIKEDLYHLLRGQDLELVKQQFIEHYKNISIEVDKIREVFKDVI